VPQQSTISVILFLFAINDVLEVIKFSVKYSFVADDLTIWFREKNTNNIQPYLQDVILSLVEWTTIFGYSFSASKS